jgi:HPt (histidine-containing phosphotransfer) domain-containing protein
MDCQMPLLDGYETTRWIRSGRVPGVNATIPVIALTAYAGDEDRARGVDAGMNAYVSKPLRIDELKSAIERVRTRSPAPEAAVAKRPDVVLDAEVVQTARGLSGARGPSLLPELVTLYLEEEPARLARIRDRVTARSEAAAAEAHSLGGNAASFGGAEVRSVALDIEYCIRAGKWTDAEHRLVDLELACHRLREAVKGLGIT